MNKGLSYLKKKKSFCEQLENCLENSVEFFFLKSILVTFLISATKCIIKKHLKGGQIYFGLQLKKMPSTVARKAWGRT